MSITALLNRYTLAARAEGLSPKTIGNVKLAVGLFNDFLGGVHDVKEVQANDLRRFIVACQQRTKWAGSRQATGEKISDTTVSSYCKAHQELLELAKA